MSRHVNDTDGHVQSLRQELIEVKQQITTDVSDKISVCNSQIVAEKQEYETNNLKVSQEIEKLKKGLFVMLTGDKIINNNNNNKGCIIITLAKASNQEETVSVVSTSNQASYQRNVSGSRACENVSVVREYTVR